MTMITDDLLLCFLLTEACQLPSKIGTIISEKEETGALGGAHIGQVLKRSRPETST
jgi:hypothetical protein